MTLSAGQLIAQIDYEIGGPVATEIGGGLAVVNMAGRHMYAMCRWASALRVSTDLAYVADQDWVALPSDYDEIESIREGQLGFALVQPAELERLRAYGTALRTGAIVHNGTSYRLELARAPDASDADALTITYRKRWVDVTTDTALVAVPDWLESLLRLLVSKFARGMEAGSLSAELAEVEQSPVYAAALRRDARGGGTRFGYVPGTGAADTCAGDRPYGWIRDGSVTLGS